MFIIFLFCFLYYRISHSSTAKPDILSSLMTSNIPNMSNISKPVNNPIQKPYNSNTNDNVTSINNWHQTTNSWHSANPLVMNHQLPAPSIAAAITNNSKAHNNNTSSLSSLDDLDPFGNSKQKQQPTANNTNAQANTFTLQKPTVDYIYPAGYQQIKTNANTPLMSNNSMAMNSIMNTNASMAPLMPQTSSTNAQQSHDYKNLNTLSQQDILSFLN